MFRFKALVLGVAMGISGMIGTADAASIVDPLHDHPDLAVFDLTASYDAGTDELSVVNQNASSGFSYTPDGVIIKSGSGTYSLLATVDSSGNFSSGTLTIFGSIVDVTAGSQTILTANLVQMNVIDTAATTVFEFIGVTTGGLAAFGDRVGVQVTIDSMSFEAFEGLDGAIGTGVSDNFALIPEPASMLGLGVLGLLVGMRRSNA